MAGTQVKQIRESVTESGVTVYKITAQALVVGTLPDLGIFVYEVVQDEDPKNDRFLRVAAPSDFGDYGLDRDASITANTRIYRASQLILTYTDIEDANASYKELTARISALVVNYDAFVTEFVTVAEGQVVIYPTVDESGKTALIASYEATLTAVTAAEEARDTEQIACNAVLFEYQTLQERLAEAQADLATLVGVEPAAYAVITSVSSHASLIYGNAYAANTVAAASTASSTDKTQIATNISAVLASVNELNTTVTTLTTQVLSPISTYIGTLRTRVGTLTADLNAKQQEVNDCKLEMAEMQVAVDTARAQRDAALAAVRAVCPDFIP